MICCNRVYGRVYTLSDGLLELWGEINTHTHTGVCMRARICLCACMRACVRACVCVSVRACMHAYVGA